MGGAVRFITKQPDSHNFYSAYSVKGGYTTGGATPNAGLSGVVNFAAIPDKLGIRIVAFVERQGIFVP